MNKLKILIFGGSGLVGSRFVELYEEHFDLIVPAEAEVDLLNKEQLKDSVLKSDTDIILNFAAFTDVGKAEVEKGDQTGLVYKLNALAVKNLADLCKDLAKHLVQISTEYVFGGDKSGGLYNEKDEPKPINWYGQTKYFGEEFVQNSGCFYTIIRISMPYRAQFEGKKDLARTFLEMLQEGREIFGCTDVINTPTFIDDIAQGLKLILEKEPGGILHIASVDSISPYNFARSIAEKFNLNETLVKPITFEEFIKGRPAALLKNSGLDSLKFRKEFSKEILHTVDEGLKIFQKQVDVLI